MAGITFVKVVDVGPRWNKVLASDGNTYTLKGDYNWRSNNPGNLEYTPFSKSMGAIGEGASPQGRSRGFAIFPSYEMGYAAQSALLFDSPSYREKTVAQAIARYAPKHENDTDAYANAVAAAAGVTLDTKMSDLTPQQRQAFLARQQQVEGFRPGNIRGEEGVPVPSHVAAQFRARPLPPVGMASDALPPAPAPLTRSLDQKRIAYAQNAVPPVPATMSPALAAARQRLQTSRQSAPAVKVASVDPPAFQPDTLPRGTIAGGAIGKAIGSAVDAGTKQVAAAAPAMVSGAQKMASDAASGVGGFIGDLFGGKTPVTKPPVSVRVPTGPTQDPVGNGASLLDLKKFNPQPAPPVVKTAGIAGTVQMPAGARPSSVPPAPLVPPTMVQHSGSRDSVAQAAAGRASGAALSAPPQVAGNALSIAPPIPHTMSPGLRGNTLTAASSPSPAALPASRAPAAPAPKFYQSGGYIYAANPTGGGYQKVGKVGGGTSSSSSSSGGSNSGGNDYFKQMTTA